MVELRADILAQGAEHLNIILLMGVAIFFGTAGAKIFQKFHIPQVVGYVVIGLIIGESGLNLIGRDTVEALASLNMFALGIIGFMIGGELRAEVFKKYGRQFFIILCSEGIAAFLLVAVFSGLMSWYFTRDIHTSIAMAIVLGAIASATAPAATVNVLWEYKTRGPLTSTVLAIVALDDGLALLLYRVASSIAAAMMGKTVPLAPEKGQLLVTERVAPFLPFPMSGIRQTGNGSVMIGYTNEDTGFEVTTTTSGATQLSRRALQVFPGLRHVRVVRSWGGLRVLTGDEAPIYDEIEENAYLLATHSAVTLASVHASLLPGWILGGRRPDEIQPFNLARFHV